MPLDGRLDVTVLDDAVEFVFTITNVGSEAIDLEFRSGKRADVGVYRDDVEVWRWSDGRMFTQALGTTTLRPDQTIERLFTWNDPPAGEYLAVAELESPVDVEDRTAFSV